jgi:L-alanine-DL-glutamate epimerase-like enolase superfamily enzyme
MYLLERGATTLLQTDATVCGGITEWRRIAATAASFGVPVAPHAWHDVHVHLVASAPNATYAEFMPDAHIVNFRKLIDCQLVAKEGCLMLPQTPGLGFGFATDAIDRYAVPLAGDSARWQTLN